ncbi:3 transmembrane region protein [Cryptosporidium ryanae]|uniref:3 transmembrane region protein n=1 Tax=Cryptosporidium ryanae TaxID=515981 RepID=UPI00351A9488|nr:3 transmembrane region protein [Cryptosporidium ryanae]
MITQSWSLFEGSLFSWEITPNQFYVTLNCSSTSKKFLNFCNNALKDINGGLSNVLKAICSPPEKYDFLSQSCEDAVVVTNYLNIVYLTLMGSSSAIILSVIFLMIYSKGFKVDINDGSINKNKSSKCDNGNEVILKTKPFIGLGVVSVILNVIALIGVCLSSVIVIYLSHIIPNLIAFNSEIPMFNISSHSNSLGWGFYLLLLSNSLLIIHILALVDSIRMAKNLWNLSVEIKNKAAREVRTYQGHGSGNAVPDKYFISNLSSPSETKGLSSGNHSACVYNAPGSAFLPNNPDQTQHLLQNANNAAIGGVATPQLQFCMPSQQVYPKIGDRPLNAPRSVWGFFPISLLPRYNPYNYGMQQQICMHDQSCHGYHAQNNHNHFHNF